MIIPFPKAFERLDIRIQYGLCFIWQAALLYLFGLALVLGISVGLMGQDITTTTLDYTNRFYLAVDPVFVIGVGSWLFFAYLISVVVPLAQAIERRRLLESCGNYVLNLFPVGLAISVIPTRISAFRRVLWRIYLTANLKRQRISHRPACCLDSGWSPGIHPPLVYE